MAGIKKSTEAFRVDPAATAAFSALRSALPNLRPLDEDARALKAVVIGGGTGAPVSIRTLLSLGVQTSAVVAISFCYGAYMGEVFRAGIMAIPKGQTEAARSLGFNRFQTMFYVVLPQAWRTILPPVGNECIAMLKDTSLVSVMAMPDLMQRGRSFAAKTYLYFETYTIVALIYLIITLILSKCVSIIEHKLNYYDRKK